jgi:hypothetical protein
MREAVEQAFATKPFVVRLRAEQKIPEGAENGGFGCQPWVYPVILSLV